MAKHGASYLALRARCVWSIAAILTLARFEPAYGQYIQYEQGFRVYQVQVPLPYAFSYQEQVALEGSQRLALLLSTGRKVNSIGVFVDAQRAFTEKFRTEWLHKLFGKLSQKIASVALKRIFVAIDLADQAEEMAQVMLAYQRATTPDGISYIYADFDESVRKDRSSDGRAIRRVLPASSCAVTQPGFQPQQWHQLTVNAVLHTPGGMVKSVTHLANRFYARIEQALGVPMSSVFEMLEIKEFIESSFREALIEAAMTLKSASVLDYGFHVDADWVAAGRAGLEDVALPQIPSPNRPDRKPISLDIGDAQITIPHYYSKSPHIPPAVSNAVLSIARTPTNHWAVCGHIPGTVFLKVEYSPPGSPPINTMEMEITVIGPDQEQSVVAVPLPRPGLPPLYPAPSLPPLPALTGTALQPPPLPAPPPLPPLPAVAPPIPKFQLCDNDRGSLNPHGFSCDEAK